jgi:hypothetical protein
MAGGLDSSGRGAASAGMVKSAGVGEKSVGRCRSWLLNEKARSVNAFFFPARFSPINTAGAMAGRAPAEQPASPAAVLAHNLNLPFTPGAHAFLFSAALTLGLALTGDRVADGPSLVAPERRQPPPAAAATPERRQPQRPPRPPPPAERNLAPPQAVPPRPVQVGMRRAGGQAGNGEGWRGVWRGAGLPACGCVEFAVWDAFQSTEKRVS